MNTLHVPGLSLAIICDGKITYHRVFCVANTEKNQPLTELSICKAASLTRPVFTYLVIKMVDKGVIHLDTPLYKYMTFRDVEYDERFKSITARMVLSNQAPTITSAAKYNGR